MHLEILVEDSSGRRLLDHLMPRFLGPLGEPHTWRLHAYRGIGRLPAGLARSPDPSRRLLLDRLPHLLRGYAKTPGIDAVVVIVDVDDRDCARFLDELKALARDNGAQRLTLFRLAIEEIEAGYLGDRSALLQAYPGARMQVLQAYVQDSIVGTWELLADAIHPGGRGGLARPGAPRPGDLKHAWADQIGSRMNPELNTSPSFRKLRDGIRRLTTTLSAPTCG